MWGSNRQVFPWGAKNKFTIFYLLAILVTSPCPESTREELGIKNWPIWTCEVSSFEWTYDDQEICFLLDGEVTVTPAGGEPVKFGTGDLVVFPAGMRCTWAVQNAVMKHYRFAAELWTYLQIRWKTFLKFLQLVSLQFLFFLLLQVCLEHFYLANQFYYDL